MVRGLLGALAALLMVAAGVFWWQGRAQTAPAGALAPLEVETAPLAQPEALPSADVAGLEGVAPPEVTEVGREARRFNLIDRDRDNRISRTEMLSLRTRDFPLLWRAVLALILAYAAFLAEIFRAGLQAVDKGQIEAAQALGLNGWQRFRHISFPQAFRMILPPLGNDFVAMVKDSSLVSVLGVGDITQLAKVTAAGNFKYFETYNVAALIYLTMTIGLSLLMRRLEKRLKAREER